MSKELEIKELRERLAALEKDSPPVKLDLGCGKAKKEGFIGVDVRPFEGVDVRHDLAKDPWPWADDSVDEVYCSHTIEHFTWPQRVFFFNELGRVMKKGGKVTLIWPHWCSDRYWGDPTHQQPISPFGLLYLNKEWRAGNKEKGLVPQAPHCDYDSNENHEWHEYTCDFDNVVSYSLSPILNGRNPEYVQAALSTYKEVIVDIQATLTKR